jgi:hypothetical protein
MGTFVAALPTLVPAVGTLVTDIVTAIKGGSSPTKSDKDSALPTATTAAAIAKDDTFKAAVAKKQPNNAATAAAAAVPKDAVQKGASKSLSASGSAAKTLSAQLSAIANVLAPCYRAEDCVFAINELLGKTSLDQDDKGMLADWWTSADNEMAAIVASTKASFSELGDQSAVNAYQTLSAAKTSPGYAKLGKWMKNPGNTPTGPLQKEANNLWLWLNAATIVGVDTISQIARGLAQIAVNNP